MEKKKSYFSVLEICLWCLSVLSIIASHFAFGGKDFYTPIVSVIGVTSLIFTAKGNPIGQALMIVFGISYGIISFFCKYYGEMITYVGMTVPMSIFALVSWLKNPFDKSKSEVKINDISVKEYGLTFIGGLMLAVIFYFILKAFNTENLVWSTVSVATSFYGVYLTFRRSPFFAVGYVMNDVVLIVLWSLKSFESINYLSMVICFSAFLVNDLYTFICWQKMLNRQKNAQIDDKS